MGISTKTAIYVGCDNNKRSSHWFEKCDPKIVRSIFSHSTSGLFHVCPKVLVSNREFYIESDVIL